MNRHTSFYRKIAYGVGIAIIALVMYWLSSPATANSQGGVLAQLREEHQLAQASLGEVDPASETMRFLTLGLRGVAVTILWEKANHYKKTEDWTNLTATLEQLAKLQPNFATFWTYQSWNLSYNVSVQFDDYHDRYYYVMRGIRFLEDGLRYNEDHPRLLSEMGWMLGHKIGRADEYLQYRRLFRADEDYHPIERTADQRDNWLVSKLWHERAIEAVDFGGKSLGTKSPREFYSQPAKAQMNYAEAIGEEGQFDKSRRAWAVGGDEWRAFGQRPIEHSSGVLLQLGDEPRLTAEAATLREELEELMPGIRARLAEDKRSALTAEERAILDTPVQELTPEQSEQYYSLEMTTFVSDRDVAERIASERPDLARRAYVLGRALTETDQKLRFTQNYKNTANFDYWQLRCDFEQTTDAMEAREKMYLARRERRAAHPLEAKKLYQEGFAKWRQVIDQFPKILDDEVVMGNDLIDYIKEYRGVLDLLVESLDEQDFPLWDVVEKFDVEGEFADELARHRQR
jgi:hypothetical protein